MRKREVIQPCKLIVSKPMPFPWQQAIIRKRYGKDAEVRSGFQSAASLQGIFNVPGRSREFSKEYVRQAFCKRSQTKDLREVGLIRSSEEAYESMRSEGVS